MAQNDYEVFYGKPGLFLEIYLPKKAQLQPLLFNVLNQGFDLRRVRAHFRSRKAGDVRRFLRRNRELREFSRADVKNFQAVFSGYSLYEVDGTFSAAAQERTQVVRVIFVPPVERLAKGLGVTLARGLFYARRFLSSPSHNPDDYYELRQHSAPFAPGERELVERMARWLYYVGLFANGYLLYEICAGIRSLYASRAIHRLEREIWVTSFRDLALNQMKLVAPVRRASGRKKRIART
jgi:hypothetical protein